MSVHLSCFRLAEVRTKGNLISMPQRELSDFSFGMHRIFENPTDQDANNLYEVTVRASDGSLYDDQVISESVTDVFENTSPSNLAAGSLTITENQPIGTVVGEFNATDPDGHATLTYHFVNGEGDGNNSLFTLDANGTLKTATTFDYETNASTYSHPRPSQG